MKYPYFVLGYNAVDYFNAWYDQNQFQSTDMKFVDNGNQQIPKSLHKNLIHQNIKNIGCAGGWNLLCDIGFYYYGYDKIIIGQEDARVSEDIFSELLNRCDSTQLCGTYNNSFEFSTFAIHRDIFEKVGRFDENFVYVGCEDNDYKYRCELAGVDIATLGISHTFNCSIANNDNVKPKKSSTHNAQYMRDKWGEYTYNQPFNGQKVQKYTDYFIELHGQPTRFPSELEFEIFKKQHNENSISQ
jgi:GT2 family glycosyltransferase